MAKYAEGRMSKISWLVGTRRVAQTQGKVVVI